MLHTAFSICITLYVLCAYMVSALPVAALYATPATVPGHVPYSESISSQNTWKVGQPGAGTPDMTSRLENLRQQFKRYAITPIFRLRR